MMCTSLKTNTMLGCNRALEEMVEVPMPKKLKMDRSMTSRCTEILKKLMRHPAGWVFNQPVDPVALKIPDYFTIVKNPMDLGTIKKKLDKGIYRTAEAFESDVRLTFSNAILYNPATNNVAIMAREMDAYFCRLWRPFEVISMRPRLDINKDVELTFRSNSNFCPEKPSIQLDRVSKRSALGTDMMKSEGAIECPAKKRSFLRSTDASEGPAQVKEPMKPEGTKIAPASQNVPAKGIVLALPSAVSKSHAVLKKEVGVISRSGVNNCPEKPSATLDGVPKRPIQRTEMTKHMPSKEAVLEKFPKMDLKADEKSKCREGPVVVCSDRSSIGAAKCPADERSCVSSKNATKVSEEASQTRENLKPEGMKRAPPRRNVPAKRAKVAVSSDGANSQPLRPNSDSDGAVSSVEDEPCSSSCVIFTRWDFASKGDALHVSMEKLQYASHQNTQHHEIMAKGNDSNRKEFYEQEQRFQKQHKHDDARLEAEIKAALQQQRETWRKAQRRMLENMKKSVFFDDDYTSLRELESLIGDCSTHYTHSVRWHTPAHKRSSSGRSTSPLSPLEQLGLFIKEEYDFDDDDDGMVWDGLEEGELVPR